MVGSRRTLRDCHGWLCGRALERLLAPMGPWNAHRGVGIRIGVCIEGCAPRTTASVAGSLAAVPNCRLAALRLRLSAENSMMRRGRTGPFERQPLASLTWA